MAVLILLSLGWLAGADGIVQPPPLELLRSAQLKERNAGKEQILEERSKTIELLLKIVQQPRQPANDGWQDIGSTRSIAMTCLGEFRAVEAVPVLIKFLEPQPGEGFPLPASLPYCPASAALIKIGKPAIPAVIDILRRELKTGWLGGQARLMLLKIEGWEVGKFQLQQAIATEDDPIKKAALESNLKIFEVNKFEEKPDRE
jgi:hypothetical protein